MKTSFSPIGNRAYNLEWVEKNFEVRATGGDEVDVLCPVHDDHSASMRINVEKGVCFCHACGVSAVLPKLAQLMGVAYSGNRAEVDVNELMRKLDRLQSQLNRRERIEFLPESELRRYDIETRYWTDPISKGGRGFTRETVEAFNLGYDPLNDCVTIPIRDSNGNLLGFTRRYLDPDTDRRYRDPKNFDKGRNLFGIHFANLDTSSYVVLTEGPLDAIKVWQAGHPAVAQFGSNLTSEQVRLLRRLGVVTVVLFYDNDEAGRKVTQSAFGWKRKLLRDGSSAQCYTPDSDLRRSFIVKRVSYRGVEAHDPGSMSDRDINRLVISAPIVHTGSRT